MSLAGDDASDTPAAMHNAYAINAHLVCRPAHVRTSFLSRDQLVPSSQGVAQVDLCVAIPAQECLIVFAVHSAGLLEAQLANPYTAVPRGQGVGAVHLRVTSRAEEGLVVLAIYGS